MTTRVYLINGRHVTVEEFAEAISALFAAGWVLTPPEGK